MSSRRFAPTVVLAALGAELFSACGQTASPPSPGATPQQSVKALDNPLLGTVDEEDRVDYYESSVTLEYRNDKFDDDTYGNSIWLHWLQVFGPKNRLAAGIELPIIHESGPDATGIGDITLEFRGMISKGEKFQQAAAFVLTVPSGSQTLIDEGSIVDGQTVLGVSWGCTGQLTEHTEIGFELRYNKGLHSRGSDPHRNYIAPSIILSQAFSKHIAGYLESDQYYEYSKSLYVPMLKPGFEIVLDREEKWSVAPYVVVPLNRDARMEETKLGVGFVLSYLIKRRN